MMLKLYENIKELRKIAGLTQEELARRTGYSDRSSIAKIERGLVDLSQSKIKQFAQVLGVAPGELLGWEEAPEDFGTLAAEVLKDPALLRLVRNYKAMGAADRAMLCALSDSLAEKQKD